MFFYFSLFKVNTIFLLLETSSLYIVYSLYWTILYFRLSITSYWKDKRVILVITKDLTMGHIYFSYPWNSDDKKERELERQCDKFNIETCFEDLIKMSKKFESC